MHVHADILESMAQLIRHHTAHALLAKPVDGKALRMRVTAKVVHERRA